MPYYLRYLRYPIMLVASYAALMLIGPYFFDPHAGEDLYTVRDYNQDMSKLYFDMGRFSQKRHDFKTAITAYTTALENDPYFLECYHYLGVCFEVCHQLDKALQTYVKALSINTNFFKIHLKKFKITSPLEQQLHRFEILTTAIEKLGPMLLPPITQWHWFGQQHPGEWLESFEHLIKISQLQASGTMKPEKN